MFIIDNGQTRPKPRKGKKGEPSKQPEPLGESRCLFRATDGKKKLSTIVSNLLHCLLIYAKEPFNISIQITKYLLMITKPTNLQLEILLLFLNFSFDGE